MIITEETKLRFIGMFLQRQIIIIQHKTHRGRYTFKVIGANNAGKWDFTPMIADTAGIEFNGSMACENLSIVGIDAADIIMKSFLNMQEDDFIRLEHSGHDLYEWVRDHLTTFYMG